MSIVSVKNPLVKLTRDRKSLRFFHGDVFDVNMFFVVKVVNLT